MVRPWPRCWGKHTLLSHARCTARAERAQLKADARERRRLAAEAKAAAKAADLDRYLA